MQERFQNKFTEHELHDQLDLARRQNPDAVFGHSGSGRGLYQPEKRELATETVTEDASEPRHLTLVPVVNVERVPEPVPVAEREQRSAQG
jgi:hypothetical protein